MNASEKKYKKFDGSLGEFDERYINGEKFYQVASGHDYDIPVNMAAYQIKQFYDHGWVFELVEPVWYENLGDGVLCWVWDKLKADAEKQFIIEHECKSFGEHRYMSKGNIVWRNAKPLTKEEALRFVWGE